MQAHTRVVGGFGVRVGAVELDVEHAVGVVLCADDQESNENTRYCRQMADIQSRWLRGRERRQRIGLRRRQL